MIGVMTLLREVADRENAYRFIDDDRRSRSDKAVRKGIECILKTQVIVRGKATVWCAQHDSDTLAAAPARSFEPISLTAGESTGIVEFLMSIERPSRQIIEAIESAVDWFKASQLDGLRWVEIRNPLNRSDFDRVVIADPAAGPLWARFYQIGTNRPIFAGRDGVIKYKVAEIEKERRQGYQWYVTSPAKLLDKDYPAWKKKLSSLGPK
jgi:PelA/Pel-15E family pectate lyase